MPLIVTNHALFVLIGARWNIYRQAFGNTYRTWLCIAPSAYNI